jgi:quercetin dioxygenase-like cupin family protein
VPVTPGDQIVRFDVWGTSHAGLATPTNAHQVMVWRAGLLPGQATRLHCQDHEKVEVVLRGSGVLVEDNIPQRFSSGDVLIVPARTVHEIVADAANTYEAIVAMPIQTRHFTPQGHEMHLPWAR